jgi:hypothetical protein
VCCCNFSSHLRYCVAHRWRGGRAVSQHPATAPVRLPACRVACPAQAKLPPLGYESSLRSHIDSRAGVRSAPERRRGGGVFFAMAAVAVARILRVTRRHKSRVPPQAHTLVPRVRHGRRVHGQDGPLADLPAPSRGSTRGITHTARRGTASAAKKDDASGDAPGALRALAGHCVLERIARPRRVEACVCEGEGEEVRARHHQNPNHTCSPLSRFEKLPQYTSLGGFHWYDG